MSKQAARNGESPLAVLGGVPALTVVLLLYTALGAMTIIYIENGHVPPRSRGLSADKVDTNFLFKLYEIRTSKLVSREKFAETAMKEMENWQEIRAHLDWDFNSAFLYCFTLYTTIGYGHVAAHSAAGKWFSVAYALAGIPLCLVYIGRLGLLVERWACAGLRASPGLAASAPGRWLLPGSWHGGGSGLPLGASAVLFGGYCSVGACLFALTERWGLLDGAYFAVISATSIGLGDLVPGHFGLVRTVVLVLYLSLGIALCTLLLNHLNDRLAQVLEEPASAATTGAVNSGLTASNTSVHADFSYEDSKGH